jgi:uncharacterized protein involved in exopolysaccharide biosynthesis
MAVELSDYMRRVLKWSWLIAVITVVGGVIALLLTSQSSTTYVTTATVGAPADIETPTQAQQYVANFQAAAGSRAVQEAVSEETEVPRNTLTERVTVNRVGDSELVSVSYRTPVRDDTKAEPVIESVVQNTLELMFEPRVNGAKQRLTSAEQAVAEAELGVQNAEGLVTEFLTARQYKSPIEDLAIIEDQILQLRITESEASADPNRVAEANVLGLTLENLQAERSVVAKDAAALVDLQDAVLTADERLVRAEQSAETATAEVAEVTPEGQTTFGRRNEPVDRAATIWRRTLAVMLACFVLSLLLVAWLASLTPAPEVDEAEVDDAPVPEPSTLDLEPESREPRVRPSRRPKHDPDGITVSAQPS